MFKECKKLFEKKIGDTYGTYCLIDHKEFMHFVVKETGWNFFDELEFDLEELMDEYIEKDEVYKPFH